VADPVLMVRSPTSVVERFVMVPVVELSVPIVPTVLLIEPLNVPPVIVAVLAVSVWTVPLVILAAVEIVVPAVRLGIVATVEVVVPAVRFGIVAVDMVAVVDTVLFPVAVPKERLPERFRSV